MRPERSLPWTAGAFGIATLAGIAALIWAQGRAVFRVPYDDAMAAYGAWCDATLKVDPVAGDRYLAMFGDRYLWTDVGAGLLATGLTGLVLTILAYCTVPTRWARTPTDRWHFTIAGWIAIAWVWVTTMYGLHTDAHRSLFPSCADSIGIPIYAMTFSLSIFAIVCTLVGLLLMRFFGTLPVPLGQWDRDRPIRSWIVTFGFIALICLVIHSMALDAQSSVSIGLPAGLIAIYLLASTRAALLAPKIDAE